MDPVYLDKNYGGILIIWDRLFGSFQPELFVKLAPTSKLAPVTPAAEVRVRRQPLTVAVVGSGRGDVCRR